MSKYFFEQQAVRDIQIGEIESHQMPVQQESPIWERKNLNRYHILVSPTKEALYSLPLLSFWGEELARLELLNFTSREVLARSIMHKRTPNILILENANEFRLYSHKLVVNPDQARYIPHLSDFLLTLRSELPFQ